MGQIVRCELDTHQDYAQHKGDDNPAKFRFLANLHDFFKNNWPQRYDFRGKQLPCTTLIRPLKLDN